MSRHPPLCGNGPGFGVSTSLRPGSGELEWWRTELEHGGVVGRAVLLLGLSTTLAPGQVGPGACSGGKKKPEGPSAWQKVTEEME